MVNLNLLAAIFLALEPALASPFQPTVNLTYAKYVGTSNLTYGVSSFFGIRYASAPVGNLRFRAPLPIESNNSYNPSVPINASIQGPACIQGTPGWQVTNTTPSPQPGSEDCLLLDVLVPESPRNASLPVMVQIHGGGYVSRNAESYPGYALVNQSQGGLVFVSIQYRLNAFGWLGADEVKKDGTANAGLLDQRAALDWVQRHISAFGGDPGRVTVSGNSAGGGSVVNQMILYGGEASPPFRAAIAEYPWWQPYHDDKILEHQYNQVLTAANCSTLQCLRSVDARTLDIASQTAMSTGYAARDYGYGDYYYGPSVDGEIIRDLPSNELKNGHVSKVALLVDRDGYEGYGFSNMSETLLSEETTDLQAVFPLATLSFFSRLYELYPASDFNSTFFQRVQIFGDFIINCPTAYLSTALSAANQPTYKMIFDAGSQIHGATVPFIFYTDTLKINNMTLAYIMKSYLLSFITHLDPNKHGFSTFTTTTASHSPLVPFWPPYRSVNNNNNNNNTSAVMYVHYNNMQATTPDPDAATGVGGERCMFWYEQGNVTRN